MNVTLKNFTPHALVLHGANPAPDYLPVAGPVPRLAVSRESLGELAGFPIVRSTMGAPEGLPAQEPGVILIVSALVAEAAPERNDLAYPGEVIRDEAGRVVGARGLCAGPGLAAVLRGDVTPCNCGSGQANDTCAAADQFCG